MSLWRVPLRHGALWIGRLVVSLFRRGKECKLCSRWHWLRYRRWNDHEVILMDRLGLDIFSTLRMKGHVLLRVRAHLKVPCWSLLCNALLTKKSLSSFCDVCSVDGRSITVGRDDGSLEQQKQDSHVCRRKRTFPLMRVKDEILDIWWLWTWIRQITLKCY